MCRGILSDMAVPHFSNVPEYVFGKSVQRTGVSFISCCTLPQASILNVEFICSTGLRHVFLGLGKGMAAAKHSRLLCNLHNPLGGRGIRVIGIGNRSTVRLLLF